MKNLLGWILAIAMVAGFIGFIIGAELLCEWLIEEDTRFAIFVTISLVAIFKLIVNEIRRV